jgi:hypothetical protein
MRHKKEVGGLVQLELLDLSHNKLTASLHEVNTNFLTLFSGVFTFWELTKSFLQINRLKYWTMYWKNLFHLFLYAVELK